MQGPAVRRFDRRSAGTTMPVTASGGRSRRFRRPRTRGTRRPKANSSWGCCSDVAPLKGAELSVIGGCSHDEADPALDALPEPSGAAAGRVLDNIRSSSGSLPRPREGRAVRRPGATRDLPRAIPWCMWGQARGDRRMGRMKDRGSWRSPRDRSPAPLFSKSVAHPSSVSWNRSMT